MGRSNKSDDEYSYIGDKGDIGFIDLDNSKTICSYNPSEESQVVRISVPFPFVNEKLRSGFVGETIYDSVTIENLTDDPLDLWSITIYDSKPEDTFTMSLMEPPNPNSDEQYIQRFVETSMLDDRILRPDRPLVVWLSCKPKDIGLHSAAVHFTVGDETIERLIFVLSEDKISQSLSSTRLYYRPRKKKLNVVDVHTPDVKFVAGRRPSSNRSSSYRLPDYPIPRYIRDMVNSQQIPDVVTEGLNVRNHSLFFKTLLAMEEIKLEEDMGAYNMEGVTMNGRRDRYLSLEVPGLAERRPSLVNGDFIFVKLGSGHGTTNVAYQGYIHRVEAEEVHLMFDQDFHNCHHESNLYNVQFSYNRVSMRRLYQAVEASERLEINFLFPSLDGSKLVQPAPLVPISCILNEEQMSAVEMILSCKGGSPYVIHGPPGTGKTVTLIEAILQIYIKSRKSRILVCAPSNSAADHILERIVAESSANIQTEEIFRLNAYTRPFDDVNPDHIKFSCVENLMFKCPSRWDLEKYRIVISTYTSASLLYSEGVKRGHFSYIFLDEAGQASEPETMVPLSQLHSRDTVVILAGDPMQLGPVLFSKDAERHGLGKSYLERLLEFEAYSSGNRNFMTKLVRNYRTHPDILHLPSELFYDGELIPCKEVDSNFLTSLEDLLPNKEFPVLFVGIQGCDEREGSNPSWFNRIEASKVAEIIRLLTEQKGLEDQDIGVITPYRQQVLKIRTALEDLGKPSIKVGSVEQFQGQEKQVIIISTVRSTVKHNEFDRVHYLGFLSNPKRFNVAITRARSLLIVMGNPHILCKDPYWNQILWYCVDNTSYKGCFLPEKVELSIVEDSIQPSDSQWGQNGDNSEPARAEWSDNGQWGGEQNSWDPSTGQWGEKQSNWEPSNGQWGELQNSPEPSNHQRDNDNSWEPSKDQWGDEGNSWEPSNDQWAKYNNSNPPKGQWGEKQNSWEPFNDHRGEGKNNWDPSTEQWGEKPNHWEPSNDQWDEEKNNRDPLEDQWGEKQNYQEPSDQWGEKQNNWEPSKDQWGEEQNNWEPSKDQWGEEQNWEPSKDQWGEEQKDQEPAKDDSGGEGNSWKPSNYQRGVEEKSGWQSNGVRGDEGKTREQSCGQRGAKQSSSKSSKDQEPSKVDWGGVGNSWKSSNHQRSDERKSGWRSNGERGDEGKTTEQYNVQQGAKKSSSKSCKDQEPSKDDWSGEGNSWKPSNHQHSVEGKSGWQANGVRGDEGKTREQSYGQQGAKQSSSKSSKDQEPSKDEWGGLGNSWKSSNNQRSDERESGWGSNGEGGDEGKNTEQSNVQQGVKQSSLKSSKDQEPSKDEWGGVGSSWKSSNHQRGDKAKSGWQSNGEKGDEGKTREQSYGQRGVKQSTSKSSKSRWVKAGDNVNTSSEAMAGVEEISDRLSKLKSRGKGKKIAPTGWKY